MNDASKNIGQTALLSYYDQAERLRQACRYNPRDLELKRRLAKVCYGLGYYFEAAGYYFELHSAGFSDLQLMMDYSLSCRRTGLVERGLTILLEAQQRFPDVPQIDAMLGSAYSELGDVEAAVRCFKAALASEPAEPLFWHGLCALELDGQYELSETEFSALNALRSRRDYAAIRKSMLHFSLAYVFHSRGEYDAAFAEFKLANDYKYSTTDPRTRFDFAAESRLLSEVKEAFTADSIHRLQNNGTCDFRPVFVIGMQRSGTTLIESIIAAHPEASARGELTAIEHLALDRLRRSGGEIYPRWMSYLDRQPIEHATDEYLELLRKTGPESLLVVDKMPSNYRYLGLITMLFPSAAIVHVQRDPMAVIWSCYQRNLGNTFTNKFADLIGQYRIYREYMSFWRDVLPLRIVEIGYRDLVENPGTRIRRLISDLGLPWNDACLEFHQRNERIVTASRFQVRQPIHRRAISGWRHYERHLSDVHNELDRNGLLAAAG